MFGRLTRVFGVLALSSSFACGGDLDVYNADRGDAGRNNTSGEDMAMSTPGDTGSTATPNDVGDPDMGSAQMPDMPKLDMTLPDPDTPTTNVPQQGPSVGEQVNSACSTIAVKGLSLQLIDEMNCLDPGVMKSFDGAPGLSYGASVFPFQQGPATDALTAVAANNPGTMPVSSALRTLPQQYLLYAWYTRGLCNANLAASPGRSNHNGGLAIDIGDSSVWRTPMRNASYIDNVSGEPWHFYFSGAGGKDVRSLSVLAFQKLYNYNFPENPIDEDSLYGPMTEGALINSPANGFTAQPRCEAAMALVAYPHRTPLDVDWEHLGDGFVGIHTLAPAGIQLVEYFVDGQLVGFADHDDEQFETVFELPPELDGPATIEVVAYDRNGEERGRADGVLEAGDAPIFVRPLGGDNYEIGFSDLPDNVEHIDYFVDGIPVEQQSWLAISRDRRRLSTQLRGDSELGVVWLDRKMRVVDMREVQLAF